MKLKNGGDEPLPIVNAVMMSLRDLKEEYGRPGLLAVRRVAMGGRPDKNTARMLADYGMITAGRMSQTVQNVILSAVTAKGDLISPVA